MKFPGEGWSPPTHTLPPATEASVARINRYSAGFRLPVQEVPEALAIWDKKAFANTGDLFTARGMYAVKAPLAEILSQFDLGEGGLTPIEIYEEDLITPTKDEYWLMYMGARKDTFSPSESNQKNSRVRQLTVDRETGLPI